MDIVVVVVVARQHRNVCDPFILWDLHFLLLAPQQQILVVVGRQFVRHEGTTAVGMQIVRQVVALGQHVGAHFIESWTPTRAGTCGPPLPGDGRVRAALVMVVAAGAGGAARVLGDLGTVVRAVDNHTAHQVGIVVGLVIDNGEHLGLDANLLGQFGIECTRKDAVRAEHTVFKGSLVLVGGAAGSRQRVGPVHFVGLPDLQVLAVLKRVRLGELFVRCVVEGALVAARTLLLAGPTTALVNVRGAASRLVVLSHRQVLGAEMPVDIDGAQAELVKGYRDGDDRSIRLSSQAVVADRDVGSGLVTDGNAVDEARGIFETRVLAFAGVLTIISGRTSHGKARHNLDLGLAARGGHRRRHSQHRERWWQ